MGNTFPLQNKQKEKLEDPDKLLQMCSKIEDLGTIYVNKCELVLKSHKLNAPSILAINELEKR